MTKKKTMKNIKSTNKCFNTISTKVQPMGISAPEGLINNNKLTTNIELTPVTQKNKNAITARAYARQFGPQVAGLLGGVAGGLISDGFSTTGGQILSGIGDAAMMFNPIIGGAIKVASGLVNRGFGTKWDNEGIAKAEGQITDLNNFQSGASDYDTLAQDFTRIGSMNKTIKASDLGEDGWFVNRTNNKANELNTDLGNAYNYAMRNANNVADNIAGNTLANLERNYAAFGGPLFAYGGQTHGSDFTNGLIFINNGGTHENNPYEGVPISMDQEGNPNLVEEGEVIWNDYVFSDRLKVPKSIQKKYKLGKREMTFANAIDKLSKESEERPNDPISMRGLENVLMNMAIEQETIKSKEQPKNKENNKFPDGGDTNPYKSYSWTPGYNGGWFDGSGNYTQAYKDYVNAITKEQMLQAFNDNYNYYLNAANKGTDRYNAIAKFYAANPAYNASLTELSDAMFNRSKQLMLDGKPGFMHHVASQMMNTTVKPTPQAATANRYFIRDADGTVTQMTDNLPFEGLNENGRTWAQLNPNYIFGGKQVRPQETIDGVPTTYTDYYYDLKEDNKSATNNISTVIPQENLPTWMRYAPAVGYGAAAISDMFGITNKPDYSNAEAIIEASKRASVYNPVRFKPIGDYLTYNPFDTEYHANQLRSVSGATRRHIMNTSGGNRAQAMAGILASDNNTMNQLGDLYRKAAEYNLEQKQKVADFNKATNITNSEGFLKADMANQSAAAQARALGLEGLMTGYKMKEQANLMSDQARASNISGLLTSLGNIGYENANRNMMNWGMANGTWAPSQWKYDPLTGKSLNK